MVEPTRVAIGLVWRGASLLVGRRDAAAILGGHAEFPGGKCESGESFADACVRECREETGIEVELVARRLAVEHDYPYGKLELEFFDCLPRTAAVVPRPPFEWIELARVLTLRFPPANQALLESLARDPAAPNPR